MTYEFIKENPDQIEASSIVLLEDGTLPNDLALSYQNDTDTGLFRPADNTFSIATDGVERVRINNDDTTFYQRVKEQSFFNNSYLCTEREGLPVVKNPQFITDMMNNFVNPYTVAGANPKQWNTMGYSETLDRLVAFGLSGTDSAYVYSNDGGINWISATILNATFNRCKWITDNTNGSRFFALHAGGNNCRFSSDGLTWTAITSITAGNQRDVVYLPSYNRYIMCNSTGSPSILVNSTPSNLATGWGSGSVVNQPDTLLIAMDYSPELNILVAVGSGGTSRLWTSSDGGLTWVNRNITGNILRAVVWAKEIGLFIAIGTAGAIFYSSNGINWSNVGTNLNNKDWTDIIWIPNLHIFVAGNVSASGNELAYSYDGLIWITQDIPGDDYTLLNQSLNYISKHGAIAFCSTTSLAGTNRSRFFITRLANRIPTGYNTFGHPFNRIDDLGNWYIKEGANYYLYTSANINYAPSQRSFRYFSLELDNVAHSNNGTFTLPPMSDGDSYIVQCYCGPTASANRQIILSNNTGFGIWDARTRTTTANGSTVVIFQAVGGIISNTSYLFTKYQFGNVHMIELGDKMGQTQPGPIILATGNQGSPSLTFSGDTDTGLFWQSSGDFRVSCNNTLNQTISQSINSLNVPLSLINGGSSSPSLRFQDSDTGFFSTGNDAINITSAGVERMYIYQDTIGFVGTNMQLRAGVNGTVGRPFLSWQNTTNNWDSGLYRNSTSDYRFSVGGVDSFGFSNGTNRSFQQLNVLSGSNSAPSIVFNLSNNHGVYCDTTNDVMSFKVGNVAVMNFSPTTSSIVSQLSTRSIINNTYLLSTGSNQTIVRLDTLVYSNFIYELTGAIDVVLPTNMTSADVGLCLRIGKNSGNHVLTIKTNGTDYLNNGTANTVALSGSSYHYVEVILVKIVAGVEYWLSHLT